MNPMMLLQALRAHAAGSGAGGPGGPSPLGGPPDQGAGGPGLPPGLGAPPGPDQDSGPSSGGDFSSLVKKMIALGVQAQQAAPDAVDANGMAQIVAKLHSFAASEQQDRDAALGTSPAIRSMRRTAASPAQG